MQLASGLRTNGSIHFRMFSAQVRFCVVSLRHDPVAGRAEGQPGRSARISPTKPSSHLQAMESTILLVLLFMNESSFPNRDKEKSPLSLVLQTPSKSFRLVLATTCCTHVEHCKLRACENPT